MNMEKYATQQLREQINKFIEQQESVPFTMFNIYRVKMDFPNQLTRTTKIKLLSLQRI